MLRGVGSDFFLERLPWWKMDEMAKEKETEREKGRKGLRPLRRGGLGKIWREFGKWKDCLKGNNNKKFKKKEVCGRFSVQ